MRALAPMWKAWQTLMHLQSQSWGNTDRKIPGTHCSDSLSRTGESLAPLRDLVSKEVDGVPENDNQDYSLGPMSTCMCMRSHGIHAREHTHSLTHRP